MAFGIPLPDVPMGIAGAPSGGGGGTAVGAAQGGINHLANALVGRFIEQRDTDDIIQADEFATQLSSFATQTLHSLSQTERPSDIAPKLSQAIGAKRAELEKGMGNWGPRAKLHYAEMVHQLEASSIIAGQQATDAKAKLIFTEKNKSLGDELDEVAGIDPTTGDFNADTMVVLSRKALLYSENKTLGPEQRDNLVRADQHRAYQKAAEHAGYENPTLTDALRKGEGVYAAIPIEDRIGSLKVLAQNNELAASASNNMKELDYLDKVRPLDERRAKGELPTYEEVSEIAKTVDPKYVSQVVARSNAVEPNNQEKGRIIRDVIDNNRTEDWVRSQGFDFVTEHQVLEARSDKFKEYATTFGLPLIRRIYPPDIKGNELAADEVIARATQYFKSTKGDPQEAFKFAIRADGGDRVTKLRKRRDESYELLSRFGVFDPDSIRARYDKKELSKEQLVMLMDAYQDHIAAYRMVQSLEDFMDLKEKPSYLQYQEDIQKAREAREITKKKMREAPTQLGPVRTGGSVLPLNPGQATSSPF